MLKVYPGRKGHVDMNLESGEAESGHEKGRQTATAGKLALCCQEFMNSTSAVRIDSLSKSWYVYHSLIRSIFNFLERPLGSGRFGADCQQNGKRISLNNLRLTRAAVPHFTSESHIHCHIVESVQARSTFISLIAY